MTEELKKTLEDKENDVHQAREKAVQEYRDSDALISELGVCYNDGFDDALRQAKALYPKLDFSSVNITVAEATSVHPDLSDDTNELFAEEVPGSVVPQIQPEEEKTSAAKDPVIPDVQTCLFTFLKYFENNWIFPVVYRAICTRCIDILTYLFKCIFTISLMIVVQDPSYFMLL